MNKIHASQTKNKNDNIHTPPYVALKMIELTPIKHRDSVLDPCCGSNKIFYENFSDNVHKEWCEVSEGRNFFDHRDSVDWCIGNPPYSLWDKWIEHTCDIVEKGFTYIFNFQNFTPKRINYILDRGFGLTKIHLLRIDWYVNNSIMAVFERGKESIISVEEKTVQCESCGKRCGRGRNGNSYNICNFQK